MTIAAHVLDALLAHGATAEMIVAAVKADAAEAERLLAEKRASAAERQRRSRARHALSRSVTVTDALSQAVTVTPPMVPPSLPPDPLPNPPLNPPKVPPTPTGSPPHSKSTKALRRLPDDWAVSEARRRKWNARGASDELIDSSAEDMRLWANGKGITRADWDATHDGFVKRDLAEGGRRPTTNGHGSRAPPEEGGYTQVLRALEANRQRTNDQPDDPEEQIDLRH